MVKIQAWQHIYGNVEVEQSPKRASGFQTIYYTQSALTEEETEEISLKLLYYASETKPIKRMFFTTKSGKICVAQIAYDPRPDRLGRMGRYISHTLVFAPEEFSKIDNNPFLVFENFPFAKTIEEALSLGNPKTGDISPVTFEVPNEANNENISILSKWTPSELRKLGLLAIEAERLTRGRRSVAFFGFIEEIEEALRTAFILLPPALRLQCSFDTYFHGCNPVAAYFWAVGFPTPRSGLNFIPVNASERSVLQSIDAVPETPYERWLLDAISRQQWELIVIAQKQAFSLSELIMGKASELPDLERVPNEFLSRMLELNKPEVLAQLRKVVLKRLPEPLVSRLFGEILHQLPPKKLFYHLSIGFELSELLSILYEVYVKELPRRPDQGEVNALGELIQQTDNPHLRFLHACWSSNRQLLQQVLQTLLDEEYKKFVEQALHHRLAEAKELLISGKGRAFLDTYLPLADSESLNADIVALVDILLRNREAEALVRLTDVTEILSKLSARTLKTLYKRVKSLPEIPSSFRHALEEALASLPLPPLRRLSRTLRSRLKKEKEQYREEDL